MNAKNLLRTVKGRASLDRQIEMLEGESDEEFILREYYVSRRSKILFLAGFLVALVVLAGYRMTLGPYDIGFFESYTIIWDHLTGNLSGVDEILDDSVIWNQRLPRIITAVLVGVGLAAAGSAMQSMMKNPLADPYTTGISSGALFGATIAMTLGLTIVEGYYGRILNAFVFAMVPAILITLLSRWKKPSPAMMILVGISIMFIFNAFQSYIMLKADPQSASSVITWSVGSIGLVTEWYQIMYLALFSIGGFALLMLMSRSLNALNSGDTYAKSLGINVDRMRIICLMTISVIAAGIVSFTGIIGFIGLVSPHIARIFVGSDNRILIPASALLGASLMLVCEIVGFFIFGDTLQIGIVTAMIGGPIFMVILLAQHKEVW